MSSGGIMGRELYKNRLLFVRGGNEDRRERVRGNKNRTSALLTAMLQAAKRFNEEEILYSVIESGGVLLSTTMKYRQFGSGDMDILLSSKDRCRAFRALFELGFVESETDIKKTQKNLFLSAKEGLAGARLELRSEAFDHAIRPAGAIVPVDQWLSRRIPSRRIKEIWVLCPEDCLLQLALHNSLHLYVRAPGIRLHKEFDLYCRENALDWNEIVSATKKIQVKTAVYFSFAIPKEIFETPIPDWVLEELAPPAWKIDLISRWIRRMDLFATDTPKFRNRAEMMLFHALLYDDTPGLLASVLDTDRASLSVKNLPEHARKAARRIHDIVTRYQD